MTVNSVKWELKRPLDLAICCFGTLQNGISTKRQEWSQIEILKQSSKAANPLVRSLVYKTEEQKLSSCQVGLNRWFLSFFFFCSFFTKIGETCDYIEADRKETMKSIKEGKY